MITVTRELTLQVAEPVLNDSDGVARTIHGEVEYPAHHTAPMLQRIERVARDWTWDGSPSDPHERYACDPTAALVALTDWIARGFGLPAVRVTLKRGTVVVTWRRE